MFGWNWIGLDWIGLDWIGLPSIAFAFGMMKLGFVIE
jgi:hypothetical protein